MKILNKYYDFKEKSRNLENSEFKLLGNIKAVNHNFPLFRIDIKSNSNSPSICFSAAIHGNESSGVSGVLSWLNQDNVDKNINYKLFPIINPFGYNFYRRTNHNRINLNREFKKENPEQEIKLIKKDLYKKGFDIFVSFHENSVKENEDFYIYSFPNNHSIKLSKFILRNMSSKVTIDKRKIIDGYKSENGLIIDTMKESFEFYMGGNHAKSSICVEIPSKLRMKQRTEIAKGIINLTENYINKIYF